MEETSLTQSAQDYLKAVYHLGSAGKVVNTNEIAEALAVAPASVTGMLKRLSKDGYVDYTPRHGAELTSKGLQVALEVIRHHRLLESFFVRHLGMDWTQAHHEAETLEHFISEELETLIDKAMGHPESDPQGSPIPTRAGEIRSLHWPSLVEVSPGADYVVRRVRHEQRDLLQYVERLGLVPGVRLRLVEIGPFEGPVVIECEGNRLYLGYKTASAIFVDPSAVAE
jgi:DtxR family Mn-dependent transcriptional regulator